LNEPSNDDEADKLTTNEIDEIKKRLVTDHKYVISLDSAASDPDHITALRKELESKKIPDKDFAEFVIETIKRTVRQEDSLVRQIFYTALSKNSANPINLAVLAPTSEGKTYPVLESVKYLPKSDVWKLGSMTPKVIIRQNGTLVDKDNEPLKPKIKELQRQIRSTKKDEEEKEELQEQLDQLYQEAKVLIDLSDKVLVFLEPPHKETWDILKPILSHDDYEIEHPYVYDVPGMGFKVKKVVTRGWPACIFCSAKNESNWPSWPEIQSRFLITSPNMVPQKYLDGNRLIAQKLGLPSLLQQSLIISNSQVELAKKCVSYILQQVRQLFIKNTTGSDSSNTNPIWIPYATILGEVLPAEKGADNRITTRILSFLTIITLARSHLRHKLEYGNENLVIANLEDFHEVLHITQSLSGIPPYKQKIFKEVFLEKYKSKVFPDKSLDGSKVEKRIGVTTRELCDYFKEKTHKTITTNNMKQNLISEFVNNGLVDEEDSNIDRRQKIYFPLIDFSQEDIDKADEVSTEKIKKLSISDRMDNILQHSRLLLPKECRNISNNWLEFEIFDLLKYPFKLDKFGLYNENYEKICICNFIREYEKKSKLNGYFSKPILRNYYSQIFGTMRFLSKEVYEKCKKLSNEAEMDNFVISDNIDTVSVNDKETRLSLRHSSAALVLTNNDLEDVENRETASSTTDKSGGGSL
jgi:hypothetical protein